MGFSSSRRARPGRAPPCDAGSMAVLPSGPARPRRALRRVGATSRRDAMQGRTPAKPVSIAPGHGAFGRPAPSPACSAHSRLAPAQCGQRGEGVGRRLLVRHALGLAARRRQQRLAGRSRAAAPAAGPASARLRAARAGQPCAAAPARRLRFRRRAAPPRPRRRRSGSAGPPSRSRSAAAGSAGSASGTLAEACRCSQVSGWPPVTRRSSPWADQAAAPSAGAASAAARRGISASAARPSTDPPFWHSPGRSSARGSNGLSRIAAQPGQWRANTGAAAGCACVRSSVASRRGRCSCRWARAPDQRETTAARKSSAPGSVAAEERLARELVGEDLPAAVQPPARAGADARVHGIVAVGAPALGEVDDADRGVAVGGDEHEPAQGLRACHRRLRQQARVGVRQPQVDEDRRALGEHAAVFQLQGGNLAQRVGLQQFGLRRVGFPRRGVQHAVRGAAALQRQFHRRRTRAGRSEQGQHGRQCSEPLRRESRP